MKTGLVQLAASLTGAHLSREVSGLPFDDVVIDRVVIDSRQITPGCLFVALRGDRFDSHDFLADVAAMGAAAVVVEHCPADFSLPAIVVPDCRAAFGEMGRYWRSKFSLPVIAVTGSNGKTTVKEMIAAILQAAVGADAALATNGNLNNEIGVPKTLFRLTDQHRAAVVELGMNHQGEIAQLAAMALPLVGVVNNAQREHQEFMQSVAAVAEENGAVILSLPPEGIAVFPAGDPYTALWRAYAGQRRVITFGLAGSGADVSCTYHASEFGSTLEVQLPAPASVLKIELAAAGEHNVRNALAAIAACHAIACSTEALVRGLQSFMPVSGRLQKKRAHNQAMLIDDTYNANPDSVRAAIDVLAQVAGPTVLVLGDMGEVGSDGPAYHEEIGSYAKQRGLDQLYTLGELACHSSTSFGDGACHFADIDGLLQRLDVCVDSKTTVLIKGSRFMKMERVVTYLMNSER